MAETNWTPGPWAYEDPMGPDILSIVANAEAPPYAWVHIAQIGTDDDDGDDEFYPPRPITEHEANARLIAASPTMYGHIEASTGDLTLLRKAIEEGDAKRELLIRVDDMMRRAEAALAKANPTQEDGR